MSLWNIQFPALQTEIHLANIKDRQLNYVGAKSRYKPGIDLNQSDMKSSVPGTSYFYHGF